MIVKDVVAAFLAWCVEHRAPKTVATYRDRLSTFLKKFHDREFGTLTAGDVDAWLVEASRWPIGHKQAGELKAPDTRRMNAIAFERLQEHGLKYCGLAKAIAFDLEKPVGRMREVLPTDEQANAILAIAPREFALVYRGLRMCGARPSEIVRASVENWDRTKRIVVLDDHKTRRKTGRARKIGVGKKLELLFLEALAGRVSGPIFVMRNGRPWKPGRLSTIFHDLREKLELPEEIVLYCARHEHATKLIGKVPIEDVARALGHSNINTTRRYIHKPEEQIGEDQDLVA